MRVATPPEGPGKLSPSANPLGTIRDFFSAAEPSQQSRSAATYIWSTVISTQEELGGGLEGAPWVAGVAQYAGRTQFEDPRADREDPAGQEPSVLVIGSPLFVEQV